MLLTLAGRKSCPDSTRKYWISLRLLKMRTPEKISHDLDFDDDLLQKRVSFFGFTIFRK